MAFSPAHRPAASMAGSPSFNNLGIPKGAATPVNHRQRRMTSPAGSLNPPEGDFRQYARPPSPLRNGYTPSTSTGIDHEEFIDDDDDDKSWMQRSPSPSSSVSKMASNLAQRVGTFVGNMGQRSPNYLPSEAELEAEAERERDRSRKEAERILTREAEDRKNVEERVLAMLRDAEELPPPSRSQTLPNPPSPSGSQKESWWTSAKNKLTPTKEPLTPAQQVIQDTKAKDKKASKGKGKEKDADWPANSSVKYTDPAFLNLHTSPTAPAPRMSQPSSPASPTPARPAASMQPPNLSPSPMRSAESISSSPARETPPIYAQFNNQGALDVHGTLLTIAKRFEKLEKWTVGHVRALEERMSDVERWLVEKEKDNGHSQKQSSKGSSHSSGGISQADADRIKEDLSEMQSRVVELGREMAKLATSNSLLSSNESLQSVQLSVAPQTQSSFAVHTNSEQILDDAFTSPPGSQRRLPSTTSDATSPPLRSSSRASSRNRLPYPTGDYAPSPEGPHLPQGVISPPSSPPGSLSSSARIHNRSLRSVASPPGRASISPSGSTTLPPPKSPAPRPSSISPTPRKRYTVALGEPVIAPPDFHKFSEGKQHQSQNSISTTYFSSSSGGEESTEDDEDEMNEETIGKRAAGRLMAQRPPRSQSPSPRSRPRPQSTYGYASMQTPQTPTTAPLQLRSRSRSSDRFGVNLKSSSTTSLNNTFIDPLVLRKQEQSSKQPARNPPGKLPVGQLVAFFDQDKKDRD